MKFRLFPPDLVTLKCITLLRSDADVLREAPLFSHKLRGQNPTRVVCPPWAARFVLGAPLKALIFATVLMTQTSEVGKGRVTSAESHGWKWPALGQDPGV